MDTLGSLGVNDGNRDPAEKTERNKALLSVIEPIILKGESWTFKHTRGIEKVHIQLRQPVKASSMLLELRTTRAGPNEMPPGSLLILHRFEHRFRIRLHAAPQLK